MFLHGNFFLNIKKINSSGYSGGSPSSTYGAPGFGGNGNGNGNGNSNGNGNGYSSGGPGGNGFEDSVSFGKFSQTFSKIYHVTI